MHRKNMSLSPIFNPLILTKTTRRTCALPPRSFAFYFSFINRDFLFCLAGIRMRSHGILPELDRLSALRIVGNSIPAVASCTAIAAGVTCIDLCKIAANFAVCSATSFTQHDSKHFDAVLSTFSHNHAHSAYNEYRREDAPSPANSHRTNRFFRQYGAARNCVLFSFLSIFALHLALAGCPCLCVDCARTGQQGAAS